MKINYYMNHLKVLADAQAAEDISLPVEIDMFLADLLYSYHEGRVSSCTAEDVITVLNGNDFDQALRMMLVRATLEYDGIVPKEKMITQIRRICSLADVEEDEKEDFYVSLYVNTPFIVNVLDGVRRAEQC